ncbi:MAG: hypothetical protein ACLTW9_09910 [Enterocloster sp.]
MDIDNEGSGKHGKNKKRSGGNKQLERHTEVKPEGNTDSVDVCSRPVPDLFYILYHGTRATTCRPLVLTLLPSRPISLSIPFVAREKAGSGAYV